MRHREGAMAIVESVYGVRKKIISLLTGCLLMMTGRMKKKNTPS